ncbi:MAG: nitroreductase family protein [Spirochaetes bacterium]|nr:nitroreductase family protein [Spirochaetota bacterium]
MELQEAIFKRRSIRKFTDYYVTDDELKQIIEAARWAPSWANTQIWSFVIVRDKKKIEEITDTYSKSNPARSCSINASALIIGCAKKGTAGCRNGVELTALKNWFMFDMGIAVQNLCLKAHDIGLGTVIVGMLDHLKIKKILKVPDDHETVVSIPIGRSSDTDRKAPPRKELDQMMFIDNFGESFVK